MKWGGRGGDGIGGWGFAQFWTLLKEYIDDYTYYYQLQNSKSNAKPFVL
jgi:hypothetical protein